MEKKISKFSTNLLPELVIVFLFFVFQYQKINLDFWNDEIYTLKHFTFTSIPHIFLDYHVPNNHILFNLINHIYLSLIGIESLSQLMDHPYLLRVIPFSYSALTLYFTYKIANKTQGRTIALLASILLITTIPFLNFSLQIRGYGLSMLLLLMLVYFGLSYLKKPKTKPLLLIVLTTTLLVYTIPSNLYFIGSVLLVYGIYLIRNLTKKQTNQVHSSFNTIISDALFQVLIATIAGLILALGLYAPIFKEVFMNEYVTGGNPFEFGKLKFYIPHLLEGVVSGRWVIMITAILGFLIKIINRTKWTISHALFLSVIITPLILVFFRGDSPPLRVFVVVLPFTSILIASGVHQFWIKIKQLISLPDYYLIFGIITYSILVLAIENQKITTAILTDIQTGNRSQNLYQQYYTHHYQPLLDINTLYNQYQKKNLPILIYGCEPHGVPNYLEKFNLPYFTKSHLDSLLSTNESIYILTSNPHQFTGLGEYISTPLNSHLTYHNTFLFERKPLVKNTLFQIDSLHQQFGDSIGFVFHSFSNSLYSSQLKPTSFFSITDDTQLGDLISFSGQEKYLCVLSSLEKDSALYHTIVTDSHKLAQDLSAVPVIEFQLLIKDRSSISSLSASEKLDAEKHYSTAFDHQVDTVTNHLTFKVSFHGDFIKNSKGVVVLSIDRNGKPIVWNGQGLDKFYQSINKEQRVVTAFDIHENLLPGDQIKIYVWNSQKETILVNNFQVELVSK